MPSGRTHDRITLWSLPLVTGFSFLQTRNGNLTLLVAAGFLFGGLMFGPDLDTYSRQYQRWGWFRWIWLPYRRYLRHRSLLSHGPVIGTTLRMIYLASWLAIIVAIGLAWWCIGQQITGSIEDWQLATPIYLQQIAQQIWRSSQDHPLSWLALWIGLELGALSHVVSDWSHSTYRRWQTTGFVGLFGLPTKAQRRKKSTGWFKVSTHKTKRL